MWGSGFVEFKIDYAQTKHLAVGAFVSSEDFAAGGNLWRVSCYPRGSKIDSNNDYLSVYLELVSKSKSVNVKAIFDAFVMSRDGGIPSASHSGRCVQVYPPETFKMWGFPRFVKRSDLELLYVANGWITIACGVIVVQNDPFTMPPSDIGKHLGDLLDCKIGTDVLFIVCGESFPAHRAVLAARSPVFKAELFGSMEEATMTSITLQDIEPAAFKIMLRFMYTDALPDNELRDCTIEMMQHLLAMADRYALDRLKHICAIKLWENVSVDTVASVLASAEAYNIPQLKSKCMDFFAMEKNFKAAAFTDGFAVLLQKFPVLAAELRRRVEI
ncbi:unnamed protein product [Urochloa decumbens]|uniref:Uncharacterized protein n=1 Tax=Urochloa decumbens TaxID=240449 RepID=A0ABC9BP00_9POAL